MTSYLIDDSPKYWRQGRHTISTYIISMNDITHDSLRKLIVDVPDYPKPGILFKDITPLLADKIGFTSLIDALTNAVLNMPETPDAVVGLESRGFILAAALADRLTAGLILARKAGKLPRKVASVSYVLEYGEATIEMNVDSFDRHKKVLIVDDLLATGGTAKAAGELVKKLGGTTIAYLFAIELSLGGRERINARDARIISLLKY
jgi:adenine phosphoribosyltransferase